MTNITPIGDDISIMLEAVPLYKPIIEHALQLHTRQDIAPYLQRGLEREARFWDSEADSIGVTYGHDLYKNFANRRRELLTILETGFDDFLANIPDDSI